MLPNDPYFKGWWNIDHNTSGQGVKERVTIILTRAPDKQLEAARGMNLSPAVAKGYLKSDPITERSLVEWRAQGARAEAPGSSIEVVSSGDRQRVVTQYYYLHESQ